MPGPFDGAPADARALDRRAPESAPRGVVLVLHGGTPHSLEPVGTRSGSLWRMQVLRDALQRDVLGAGHALWLLRYARRGDITPEMHFIAIREGRAFADTIFGNNPRTVDYSCVPSAVFSHPPMCGVGLTESQARDKLGSIKVYTSDFRPMKNVLAGRNERSLYKLVCDGADKIVGIHLLGPDSPEILQAAAIAVKAGLTKADFDATVAIHPTMAEELVLMR